MITIILRYKITQHIIKYQIFPIPPNHITMILRLLLSLRIVIPILYLILSDLSDYAIRSIRLYQISCVVNSIIIAMSCHYSCATCTSAVYLYNCLSCPSTRTLLGTTCVCQNGYIETQTDLCILESQASSNWISILYTKFLPLGDGLFYINLSIFWLYVLFMLCRGNSPHLRMLINFAQVCSLAAYLPYRLDEVSDKFIKSLSGFNFGYFFQFTNCTQTGLPTVCTGYENLIGYGLIWAAMTLAVFVSFFITVCLYSRKLDYALTFRKFIFKNITLIIFTIFDLSALYLSVCLSRILLLNKLTYIPIFICIVLYSWVFRNYFRIVNSIEQAHLKYRMANSWAYPYDQKYHLYYIDFLYSQEMEEKQKLEQEINDLEVDAQNLISGRNQGSIKAFFPKSNLVTMEIIWKAFMGASVVLLFQYKPSLMVFSTIFLVFILVCWIQAFFSYQKLLFWSYMFLGLPVIACFSLFWLSFFWGVALVVGLFFTVTTVISLIVAFYTCNTFSREIINQIFYEEEEQGSLNPKNRVKFDNQEKEKKQKTQQSASGQSEDDLMPFATNKDKQFQIQKQQLRKQMEKRKNNLDMQKFSAEQLHHSDTQSNVGVAPRLKKQPNESGTIKRTDLQKKFAEKLRALQEDQEEQSPQEQQNIFNLSQKQAEKEDSFKANSTRKQGTSQTKRTSQNNKRLNSQKNRDLAQIKEQSQKNDENGQKGNQKREKVSSARQKSSKSQKREGVDDKQ